MTAVPGGRPLLQVSREEEGLKLARFLERRLGLPGGMIRKWIRTGQTRVNGKRAGPFSPLCLGDRVRLPPFIPLPEKAEPPEDLAAVLAGAELCLAACTEDLLVLHKPGGLVTHPGSRHADSVTSRLAKALAGQIFLPAPAHRLDRRSSGLLMAGRTHRAQERLHLALATGRGIVKDYLAWAAGIWPEEPSLLTDMLGKRRDKQGKETMQALPGGRTLPLWPGTALPPAAEKEARCLVVRAGLLSGPRPASLLLIRLLTGKTHQIRVQTASRGFPLLGDAGHGGPAWPLLLLHAWRLRLAPGLADGKDDGLPFECRALPDWPRPYAPKIALVEKALARLEDLTE
ncbi:MAG: RluA family pseudouridine synthase [Deltaproteobacteria bacterium]|jgi:23S rRNA pseudouridine955/2504/2580 synthase|nr:RluA family pseudouridine synthase [Deltaproteobacteria bacterium]